jgi:hypothetical protein
MDNSELGDTGLFGGHRQDGGQRRAVGVLGSRAAELIAVTSIYCHRENRLGRRVHLGFLWIFGRLSRHWYSSFRSW